MHSAATKTVPVCIVNDTRVDRHHGCARVMAAIDTLLARNGFHVVGSSPAHEDWEANPHFMRAFDAARLVIVNGEGTLHHDRPAGECLLRIGQFAQARGVPAILINAGWEANGPEFFKLLQGFTLIAARDSDSARQIRQGGLQCRVVPDLSLFGSWDRAPSSRSGGIVFSDNVDRFKAIALDHCRRTVNGKTLSIVYPLAGIPGYLQFIRAGFAIRDTLAPRMLMDIIRLRHTLWQNASEDIAPFIASLAQAQLLVSGRFHACTLALTTGTPFVAIPSNTGKIASLIADAGLERWRADTELTPEAISRACSHGWSSTELHALREYRCAAQVRAAALFSDIRALV